MPDSYTEHTHTGYGRRVGNSIKGMLFGGIMFIGSFPLLMWNEGRAVKETNSLIEGKRTVVNLNASQASPQTDGLLVFSSGKATTDETLKDPVFGVAEPALKLRRKVEMYQWDEDKDSSEDSNGNTKTTYNYNKEWSSKLISSSSFKYPSGHENPSSMPFQSEEREAIRIFVGTHILSAGLVSQISKFAPLALTQQHLDSAPAGPKGRGILADGGLYYGRSSQSPEIGDIRVRFSSVKPLDVSFVARQAGETFGPFQTKAGNTIELLEEGLHNADYVFERALSRNAVLTWILRGVGFFVMFFGLCLILGPLTTITGVIPIVGSVVGLGVGLASFVLALFLSLVTIALSWIAVRPIAAGIVLVVGVAFLWGAKRRGEKRIAGGTAPIGAMPPPPPPPTT